MDPVRERRANRKEIQLELSMSETLRISRDEEILIKRIVIRNRCVSAKYYFFIHLHIFPIKQQCLRKDKR